MQPRGGTQPPYDVSLGSLDQLLDLRVDARDGQTAIDLLTRRPLSAFEEDVGRAERTSTAMLSGIVESQPQLTTLQLPELVAQVVQLLGDWEFAAAQ